VISSSGIYFDSLKSLGGCDSFIEYRLSFLTHITFAQNLTVCAGKSITLPDGSTADQPGIYRDTLLASFGCDSIVITDLAVEPYLRSAQSAIICPGSIFILPGGASVNQAGMYNDTIQNANGCDSIVTITLSLLPYITSSRNDTVCSGQPFTLPGGTVVNTAGTYSDTLQTPAGCDSVVTTFLAHTRNNFRASLPATDTIIKGQSIQLFPEYQNGTAVSWSWTPNTNLSCADCEAPIASPLQTLVYIVSVTNQDECSDTASTRIVVVEPGIFVPNAFSPNGDGLNDRLEIFSNGVQSVSFSVFNRWGEKIFGSDDLNITWDGTLNGEFLLIDDYVYTISAILSDGTSLNKSGTITLVR
jgi:gliding motility-associated-like protein